MRNDNVIACYSDDLSTQARYLAQLKIESQTGLTLVTCGYSPLDGYSVGIGNDSYQVVEPFQFWRALDEEGRYRVILNYLRTAQTYAAVFHGHGIWMADGFVYLEPVMIVENRATAYRMAKVFSQQAIYNMLTDEVEYLDR